MFWMFFFIGWYIGLKLKLFFVICVFLYIIGWIKLLFIVIICIVLFVFCLLLKDWLIEYLLIIMKNVINIIIYIKYLDIVFIF